VLPCVDVFVADEFLRWGLGAHLANVRSGTQLADVPCIALGHPTCGRALHCIGAPNLGEAVLKSLPPSQNFSYTSSSSSFSLVLPLDIFLADEFCVGASCGRALVAPNLRTDVPCGRALGRPTCERALRCVGAPNLRTCLVMRLGAHLAGA
jgi:hypothetical protein